MEIVSSYIDHTFLDEKTIGKFFQNNMYNDSDLQNFVCVSTCHRMEYYSIDLHKQFSILDTPSKYTQNTLETAQRLIEILVGVQSVILGEPYVKKQLINAFSKSKNKNITDFFSTCLEIADQVRSKYNFYNEKNYLEIGLSFLPPASNLLVIGGGMLVQKIIEMNKHTQIQIITRNPKKLKKQINAKNVTIEKIENAKGNFTHCMIATVIQKDYSKILQNYLDNSSISTVIDLSSVPLYKTNPKFKYISMYDKSFKKEIDSSNKIFKKSVNQIKQTIQQTVINRYRDLI